MREHSGTDLRLIARKYTDAGSAASRPIHVTNGLQMQSSFQYYIAKFSHKNTYVGMRSQTHTHTHNDAEL